MVENMLGQLYVDYRLVPRSVNTKTELEKLINRCIPNPNRSVSYWDDKNTVVFVNIKISSLRRIKENLIDKGFSSGSILINKIKLTTIN